MKRKTLAGRKNTASKDSNKKAKKQIGDDAFDWSGAGADGDVIASDSELDDDEDNGRKARNATADSEDDEEEPQETADEKRIRLAKEYLDKIAAQQASDDENDDNADAEDRIAARLHQDALEASGKLFKTIAHKYEEFEFDEESVRFMRGHRLPVTSVCLMEDGRTAFSAAKDGSLLRWDLAQQKKTKLTLPDDDVADAKTDHDRCILSVAVSSDGKFLASGGCDKLVRVWDTEKNELLESFSGHRDVITSVCFRLRSHSLFTGSLDRTIKHWNLTEMAYIETLFGHQSEVNGLDSQYKERVVSCGRDRSVRMWKIPEETQLVFYGNSGSMDCVKMVNDEYYVTGGDDGSLSLWFNGRKKPVCVIPNAHGAGKWISSVAVMPRTDLVASGSCDGQIRLWKADVVARSLEPVATIPVSGFVNSLCFEAKGRFLLAGVGQEHRLGRWERIKAAKNGIAIIALPNVDDNDDNDEESEASDASEPEDQDEEA